MTVLATAGHVRSQDQKDWQEPHEEATCHHHEGKTGGQDRNHHQDNGANDHERKQRGK